MSKRVFDEDEIIGSIVDENQPAGRRRSAGEQQQGFEGFGNQFGGNVFTQQVGCGCLNPRQFMINFAIYIVVLMVTAGLFRGFHLDGVVTAISAAFTLSVLNVILKPFLLLVTFPLTFLTMGFFYFVINGLILSLTATMVDGFIISNFFTAIFAAIFISVLQSLIKKYLLKSDNM